MSRCHGIRGLMRHLWSVFCLREELWWVQTLAFLTFKIFNMHTSWYKPLKKGEKKTKKHKRSCLMSTNLKKVSKGWSEGKKKALSKAFHISQIDVGQTVYVFPQTSAEIMFTPYSRQMQLWPMMQSTLCPCHTSTRRRWRWTRCSATATNPGDSEDASWVSSKRWWEPFGLLLFHLSVIDIRSALTEGRLWQQQWSECCVVIRDLDIYPANQSFPPTKQTEPW